MQGNLFQALLEGKAPQDDSVREELMRLADEYPWFQAAHVLLSKFDHDTKHVAYDAHLKRAAVYVTQREALYNLLMRDNLRAKVADFDEAIEPVDETPGVQSGGGVEPPVGSDSGALHPAGEAEKEKGETEAESKNVDQETDKSDGEQLSEERKTEPISADAGNGDLESEAKTTDNEEGKTDAQDGERVKAKNYDDLEREILFEAITSTIKQEVSERESETEEPQPSSEEPSESAFSENDIRAGSSNQSRLEGTSAYAQWLLSQSRSSAGKATGSLPGHGAAAIDPKKKQQSLIEKFIETEPKITPGKAEFFSTENLAKMSVVEDESFVTETMAQIFARQGNVKKAIKAYKTLSLKYPEKSVYFANQIKKLQERRKT